MKTGNETVVILSKRVSWYGGHSGYYEMLPASLERAGAKIDLVTPQRGIVTRLKGKLWAALHGLPPRDQSVSEAEWRFFRRIRNGQAPGLMLAVEDNLPLLSTQGFATHSKLNVTGVIHYPAALWDRARLENLRRLRSALVLYRADIPFFETYIGKGRVKYVPHGVDTEFFSPAPSPVSPASPRILLSGQFARDFQVLLAMFRAVSARVPKVGLDIVGAHHASRFPEVKELASLPGVVLHPRLSDEELLRLYRTSTLMVLPLIECGANNALVEAISSGLPVVATDVGGVRDYGGGTIFPIVPKGDAPAMSREVEALLVDGDRRRQMSKDARTYAARELSWEKSAEAHLQALDQLA